jgi:O-antigen ligase
VRGLIPPAILVALASGSRGPLLALIALIVLAAAAHVLWRRSVNWRMTATLVAALLATVTCLSVSATLLPASATQRFAGILAMVDGDAAGAAEVAGESRVALYNLALTMTAERPILGYGTASFESLSRRRLDPAIAAAYPHNALLQFGAEYGLVGIVLFGAAVLIALLRGPRDRTRLAVELVFGFFLLNAMVSGNILEDRTLWGLLLLLLCAPAPPVIGDLRREPPDAASHPLPRSGPVPGGRPLP